MCTNASVADYFGFDLFDHRPHQASGGHKFDALPAHADQKFSAFGVTEGH
jgi:hypothetical protein